MNDLNNISGEYQDIEVDGVLFKKGKRECSERWEIIKPYIRSNSSFVDIGSFHGYFGIKICREIENSVVLSIESNRKWAEEQSQIVEMNNLANMAVGNYSFSLNDLKWMDKTVEGIDYIIMFSSLEYFGLDEIEDDMYYISKICPKFIVEFPDKEEVRAAGKEAINRFFPLEKYLKKYFEKVQIIGESIATTDHSLKRKIYLAENSHLLRTELFSSKDHNRSRTHTLEYANDLWKMKEVDDQKREWITGFNLHNLLKFNIIYPLKDWFLKNARSEYLRVFEQHKNISDISLKNLLFTPRGLEVIDYLEIKKVDSLDKFEEDFKRFITEQIK